MKIGVEMQALQSDGCRHRGIGRYTHALLGALLQTPAAAVEYEFYANRTLPTPALDVGGRPWRSVPSLEPADSPENELLLKAALLGSNIDALLLPNPMYGEDIVMPGLTGFPWKVFAICYDLIPLLFPQHYLRDPAARGVYAKRLENLRGADTVFAISEATRQDLIGHLNIEPRKVVNISGGVSEFYRTLGQEERRRWAGVFPIRFGLTKPFVLYTGGVDWRKNLIGLVEAFGRLPARLRSEYQLVIPCRPMPAQRQELAALASHHGCREALVFTDYLTDEEMRALYDACSLFVFPSLYEGFGLPLLEAMACGAPVIAADNSSLPEIVGDPERLFDARSPDAMAASLHAMLTDERRRERAAEEGLCRAARFSWQAVARKVEEAFLRSDCDAAPVPAPRLTFRRACMDDTLPRMAFFSSFRPVRSGISDAGECLLPALARHFQIDLYHDRCYQPEPDLAGGTFARHTFPSGRFESCLEERDYEALIYQVGNNEFHVFIYVLMMRYAGIAVLHDYHLSGLLKNLAYHAEALGLSLKGELAHSYGPGRAQELLRLLADGRLTHAQLPEQEVHINRRIFSRSLGVIVHNRWAYDAAIRDFGAECDHIAHIPLATPHVESEPAVRDEIRRQLGVPEEGMLLATFGFAGFSKRPVAILNAFRAYLRLYPAARLLFVGKPCEIAPESRVSLRDAIRGLGLEDRVHVTGFVEMREFCRYIQATDIGLNLRFPYNGESSGSLLQLMSHGKPVIVTDIGSFSEFPDDVVLKIPPPGQNDEVREILDALVLLTEDTGLRRALGDRAAAHAREQHAPERCALLHAQFIETVMRSPSAKRKMLADYVGRQAVAFRPADPAALFKLLSDLITHGSDEVLPDPRPVSGSRA